MSWATVSANIVFWAPGDTWDTQSHGLTNFASTTVEATIKGYLQTLYNGSPTAAALLERATGTGSTGPGTQQIRIGLSPNDPGLGQPGGVGVGYLGINLSLIQQVRFINDHGVLVADRPELTLMHELKHAIDTASDPRGYGSGVANWDYRGDAVDFQNTVAAEMGWTTLIQASYQAATQVGSARYPTINVSGGLTNGDEIDHAILGDATGPGADTIDLSSRTDNSRDLIVGFDGDDALRGGGGRDYLYGEAGSDTIQGDGGADSILGGAGADSLSGGQGADTLLGGDDDDFLVGDAGADSISGGAGEDVLGCSDGADTIDGGDGSDVFSMLSLTTGATLSVSPTGITDPSAHTIKNIETVITTNEEDTVSINVQESAIFLSTMDDDDVINITSGAASSAGVEYPFLFLHLGDGDDTVNIDISEFVRPTPILIGGDAGDVILFDGYSVSSVYADCNTQLGDSYVREIAMPEGGTTWDRSVTFTMDSERPGWIMVDFYRADVEFVIEDGMTRVETSNEVVATFYVFGFEAGDYGIPNVIAPGSATNTQIKSQVVSFVDELEDWNGTSYDWLRSALSSNATWDTIGLA